MATAPTSGDGSRQPAEALSAACNGNTHSGRLVPGDTPSEVETRAAGLEPADDPASRPPGDGDVAREERPGAQLVRAGGDGQRTKSRGSGAFGAEAGKDAAPRMADGATDQCSGVPGVKPRMPMRRDHGHGVARSAALIAPTE